MKGRTIFGRDPALFIGLVTAFVIALVSFRVPGVDAGAGAAIIALVTSLVTAFITRPWTPVIFTGIVTAAVALFAEYGFTLREEAVSALTGLTLAIFAFLTRPQVSPKSGPVDPTPSAPR